MAQPTPATPAGTATELQAAYLYEAVSDTPILLWHADERSRCTFFNKAWIDFVGPEFESEMSLGSFPGLHSDDKANCQRIYNEAYEHRIEFELEYRVLRHDKSFRWLLEQGKPRYDGNGQFAGFVGWAVDITERKEREEHLRSQQDILFELAKHQATVGKELKESLQAITETACRLLNLDRCGIWLFSEDRKRLECADLFERREARHSNGLALDVSDYPIYFRGVEEHRTIPADDAQSDPLTHEFADSYLRPLGITSMIDSGIRLEGRTIGVVCHEHVGPRRKWTIEEISSSGSIADMVALAFATDQRKRSVERFALAVQGANDGIWDWDLRSKEVYFSARAKAIIGYREDELDDKLDEWRSRVHPEDLSHLVGNMDAHLNGLAPYYESEHRVLHKDGTYRWVFDRGVCVRDSAGKPYRVAGSITDITARRTQEQEKLRASVQKYEVLAQLAPVGIGIIDRSGRINYVNPQAEAHLGRSKEEVLNKLYSDPTWGVLTLDERPTSADDSPVQRVFRTKKPVLDTILTLPIPGGEKKVFSVNVAPLLDGNGEVDAVILAAIEVTERIRMETALRESEFRFRQMAENIDVVFYVTDPNSSQIYYVSPAYEKIWGCSRESLYANPLSFLDTIHPEDRDRVQQAIFKEPGGGGFELEYRIIQPDQSVRWVRDRAFPVRNARGEITLLTRIAEDITERRLSQEILSKTQEELQTIFEQAAVGLTYVSIDGRFLRVNQSFCNMLGYSQEELTKKTVLDVTHPDDIAISRKAISDGVASREGFRWSVEKRYVRKDGQTIWANVSVAKGSTTDRFITVTEDITARKRDQEEIRFLASLTSLAGQGICAIENGHKIVFWNQACEKLFGWKASEVLGRNLIELLVPTDRRAETNAVTSDFEKNVVIDLRTERLHRDGRAIPVSVTSFPVTDASGAFFVRTFYFLDISEISQMKSALQEKSRMATIGELAAAIAHEIRNPLFGISSVAQILSREISKGSEKAELADSMLSEISRLNRLLENLLLYSRPRRLDRAAVSPKALWSEILDLNRSLLSERQVKIDSKFDPTDTSVLVDPSQFRQVLLNLLINAVQASEPGGTVQVRSNFNGTSNAWNWRFEIANGGEAIPPEFSEKIFEPFFSTKGGGSGLGLSVCRKIVQDHGGTISLIGSDAAETLFRVEIPFSAPLTGRSNPV